MNILDSEPFLDWWQQRSISSTGLRRTLRHCDPLYDTSPSLCQRGVWFSGRAESWRSHGRRSHGQPVWRISWHACRHQRLWSQHGPWPQVLQYRRFAYEGKRAQCSHILGNMRCWDLLDGGPCWPLNCLDEPSMEWGGNRMKNWKGNSYYLHKCCNKIIMQIEYGWSRNNKRYGKWVILYRHVSQPHLWEKAATVGELCGKWEVMMNCKMICSVILMLGEGKCYKKN